MPLQPLAHNCQANEQALPLPRLGYICKRKKRKAIIYVVVSKQHEAIGV